VESKPVALITGVTGQDGSYLAEFLLKKGYEVHGLKRRSSSFNTQRVDHIYEDPHLDSRNFFLHYGDVTDSSNIHRLVRDINPNEIYNLAAQSHVQVSFETPEYTANADALGPLRILEAVRLLDKVNEVKFYQASTSEMFGLTSAQSLNENSPFYPRSPYAIAKLYAYWITKNYREAYGMYAANGILFNHESPRRGETFVTKKVVDAAVNRIKGSSEVLYLGNLDAVRDWGHAKDYVEGMWLILQNEECDDWVLATGQATSVRQFTEKVFSALGIPIKWSGTGINERGLDTQGNIMVAVDPRYFRPTEVPHLLGDASKARKKLGWSPKVNLDELIKEMISSQLDG
jgi:GDPmannose 4,6-dehydratase